MPSAPVPLIVCRLFGECLVSVYGVFGECLPSVWRVFAEYLPSVCRVFAELLVPCGARWNGTGRDVAEVWARRGTAYNTLASVFRRILIHTFFCSTRILFVKG